MKVSDAEHMRNSNKRLAIEDMKGKLVVSPSTAVLYRPAAAYKKVRLRLVEF